MPQVVVGRSKQAKKGLTVTRKRDTVQAIAANECAALASESKRENGKGLTSRRKRAIVQTQQVPKGKANVQAK